MSVKWLCFNDPFFTDSEPYCNTLRFITEGDAIKLWRRIHSECSDATDEVALSDFMVVNHAWVSPTPPNHQRG